MDLHKQHTASLPKIRDRWFYLFNSDKNVKVSVDDAAASCCGTCNTQIPIAGCGWRRKREEVYVRVCVEGKSVVGKQG